MCTRATEILPFLIFGEADLLKEVKLVEGGSGFYKGKVEKVTVVGGYDGRPDLSEMFKKALQQGLFVWLVENSERALILRFGRVLKVFDVFRDDLAIRNQIALFALELARAQSQPELSLRLTWPSIMYEIIMI